MKKMLKISMLILLIITIASILTNTVMAYDYSSKIDTYAKKDISSGAVTSARNIVGTILSVVRIVAVGIAIIMLMVLAMKYMMAAPGDKADIKKHAVVYVVGAVVLFASSGILTIIANFAANIPGSSVS